MRPLQLPHPDDSLLERSPLSLVVCQVRHERLARAGDSKYALAVHELLEKDFPVVQESTGSAINLVAGPGGVQATPLEARRAWQFQSDDRTWTATLQEEFFSIETSAYSRWDEFRRRFAALTRGVDEVLKPSIEQRVGLRFVDQITEPEVETPADWRGLVEEALLGPAAYEPFAPAVSAIQQLVELVGPDDTRVNLRHGSQPLPDAGGHQLYLVDTDCYRQVGRRFQKDAVLQTIDQLHLLIKQVFQATITKELYLFLKGGAQ